MTANNNSTITNNISHHREDESSQALKVSKGTQRIKFSPNLTSFPSSILTAFNTLTHLDLSNNASFSTLPASISRLHCLKIAFFSNCSFATFPRELAQCRSLEMVAFKNNHMTRIPPGSFPRRLRWLILTGNEIEEIPEDLGDCSRLQKCMLAGNRLRELPGSMRNCRKLGLLRVSGNQLEDVPPSWVGELPELSFLSFAGNPGSAYRKQQGEGEGEVVTNPVLEEIDWEELEVQHLLGEGASGVISKGIWKRRDTGEERDVAIKLFKGEVTSDGSPLDEMNATIMAGKHANLIDPLGRIHNHPDGKKGLVLQLIPPTYTNLGGPPTLESCTRDSFPQDMVLSLAMVKKILRGIAAAAAHLHDKGIMHGDLYAHNILYDRKTGHALLGDFGAASIYGSSVSAEQAGVLERMEVLGFGHLVEDLLGLVEHVVVGEGEGDVWDEKDAVALEELNRLHWRCSHPVVGERPGFTEVIEALDEF